MEQVTYTYSDTTGLLEEINHLNGVTEQYSYDELGRLAETTEVNAEGTARLLDRFGYDPVGNIISRAGAEFTAQIKDEQTENQYNNLNQLTERTIRDGGNNITHQYQYAYDNRGNLIEESDILNSQVKTYQYDATSRMVLGTNSDGETSAYSYNGLGVLVRNTAVTNAAGSVVTDYAADYTDPSRRNLIAVGSDGLEYQYVYGIGLNRVSAAVTDSVNAVTERFTLQNDRLGSGRYATDTNGLAAAKTVLDEWGNPTEQVLAGVGSKEVDVLNTFTNHEFDSVLGVYYAKARFYDPETARWLAADSHWNAYNRIYGDNPDNNVLPDIYAIRQSANLYGYVGNNPVRFIDPTGENIFEYWSSGIEEMHQMGGAWSGFASYSEGVMDAGRNMGNTILHPIQTIDKTVEAFIEDPLRNNPISAVYSFYENLAISSYNHDWNRVGYSVGNATVVIGAVAAPATVASAAPGGITISFGNGGGYALAGSGALSIEGFAISSQAIANALSGVAAGSAYMSQFGCDGGSGDNVNTPTTSGTAQAPKTSKTPNSIYEQIGPDGNVVSRTFYDSNGNAFARQDFTHPHFDKVTQQNLMPHEHNTTFNQNGQSTGTTVNSVPSGY